MKIWIPSFRQPYAAFLLWLCTVCMLPLGVSAQENRPLDLERPVLVSNVWKVSRSGQPDSYLLGTVHMGREGSVLSQDARRLLNRADVLVTEVDMLAKADSPEAAELVAGLWQPERGARLSSLLGKDFPRLQNQWRKHSATRAVAPHLDRLRPWGVLLLGSSIPPSGYAAESGVDILLSQAAIAAGKPRRALEKLPDSIQVFKRLPEDVGIELIRHGLNYADYHEQQGQLLLNTYAESRFDRLAGMVSDAGPEGSLSEPVRRQLRHWMDEELLIKRNHAWLPQLTGQMRQQRLLVAVGIAHLMSDEGLIEALRREGYTVTPEPSLRVWR